MRGLLPLLALLAAAAFAAACGGRPKIGAAPQPGWHPSSIRLYEDAMAAGACAGGTPEPRFYPGTAELLPGEQLAVEELGRCMQAPQFATLRLEVVGGADRSAPDAAGRALAFQRAARVEEILVDAGVAPQRIATLAAEGDDAVGRVRVAPYR